MSIIDLGIIRGASGDRFSHVIDTDNDSTYVLNDEQVRVLEVDYSASVFDDTRTKIGYFYMTADETWFYIDERTRDITITGFKDLLKAERYVFGQLI